MICLFKIRALHNRLCRECDKEYEDCECCTECDSYQCSCVCSACDYMLEDCECIEDEHGCMPPVK